MNRFEVEQEPPLDDKGFNDPDAWGFCDYCAFEVAVYEGLRVAHRAVRNGFDDGTCLGSLKPPVPGETPYIVAPRAYVRLRKDIDRARSRAYWQRMRQHERDKARFKKETAVKKREPLSSLRGKVKQVLLYPEGGGEPLDLTPHISGEITIQEAGDAPGEDDD